MTNYNGIEMPNDRGRSPEFKITRNQLIADVNVFLDDLRSAQASGGSVQAGILETTPRVKQTSMGPIGPKTHALVTEYTLGAALYQQKPEAGGPFTLVVVTGGGDKIEKTHVTGMPEASRAATDLTNPISDHPRREIVASFGVENSSDGEDRYYRYDFFDDGAVSKQFTDMFGADVKQMLVKTVEGVQMAQAAFDQIKANIL